jgi:ABC-type glycerol-3-phosphate transport system permease component
LIKKKTVLEFFRYLVLIIIVLGVLFPLYWMILSSLKPAEDLFSTNPTLLPERVSLEWYKTVIANSNVGQYFLNSFIVATSAMLISLVVTTMGAYSLTRFKYKGRKLILLAVLSSYVFPSILLLLPLYNILSSLGLLNSFIGIIITHTTITIPYSLWILKSYFQDVPPALEEAGMIDGLTRFGTFIHIVIPVTKPGILSCGLFSFILSWDEYLYASVFLTESKYKTLTIGIMEYITSFDVRWGEIMATSTITTLPVLIIFILIQKHFVKGLTAGAVKG